ncbi:unnamed protein product [Cuscuta epithymum]|uniref:Secreted protein n=1 Tax=Cuscuta epithymum TaxID=186058 RepID=A0AAV0G786_9ASTE|nr:unnamed protein product [Cuscuta epithymum]
MKMMRIRFALLSLSVTDVFGYRFHRHLPASSIPVSSAAAPLLTSYTSASITGVLLQLDRKKKLLLLYMNEEEEDMTLSLFLTITGIFPLSFYRRRH